MGSTERKSMKLIRKTTPEELKIPEIRDFILFTPLYERVDFRQEVYEYAVQLKTGLNRIDGYCPNCEQDTVFAQITEEGFAIAMQRLQMHDSFLNSRQRNMSIVGASIDTEPGSESFRDFHFSSTLECTRDLDHRVKVFFVADGTTITKIGQTPSIADLQFGKFKQFKNVLEKKYYTELTKAIGLKAHGVGIGSFVYLRRIFENLIEEAHSKVKLESNWNENLYQKMRVPEKVDALKEHLPTILVENKNVYGILSQGIHELDEQECLAIHDFLLESIKLFLEEKEHARIKDHRQGELRKNLSSIRIPNKRTVR